ncbi:MAG: phosphatase PAP2 family protein [Clostridia bacterium]|nr:phosphatase PAP2 family protein [Clostridia bacterium]
MITTIDFEILNFIQEHMRSGFGDIFMKAVTALGDHGILYIALTLILLFIGKTRKTGIRLAAAMIISFVLCNLILKNAVGRIRPYAAADFQIIISPLSDFSFPSGHTLFAFAFASVIFSDYRRWGIASFIIAALIGFSRLYLYVHYPTDVIAGAILGGIIGVVTNIIFKANKNTCCD